MKVENVFCYGTLKPDNERWHVLQDKIDFAMPATLIQARIYDHVGAFPFMRPSHDSSDEVHGYVCRISLEFQETILDTLDAIEGYPHLFDREYFSVRLDDSGERVNAVVYFGVHEPMIQNGVLIESGVW